MSAEEREKDGREWRNDGFLIDEVNSEVYFIFALLWYKYITFGVRKFVLL